MPNARAHATAAILAYAGLAVTQGVTLDTLAAGCAVAGLAALAPDLDRPGSCASRLVWPITYPLSLLLGWAFGHRGFVHSALLLGMVTLLAWYALPFAFTGAVALGVWSHWFLDALTPAGVPFGPGGPRLRLGFGR